MAAVGVQIFQSRTGGVVPSGLSNKPQGEHERWRGGVRRVNSSAYALISRFEEADQVGSNSSYHDCV